MGDDIYGGRTKEAGHLSLHGGCNRQSEYAIAEQLTGAPYCTAAILRASLSFYHIRVQRATGSQVGKSEAAHGTP